jgi:PPOX class probable F420-dependent enzyme
MNLDDAREFVRRNPRAVLATRKQDGSPQLSPVIAVVDDEGRLLVSSRETAFKTKNLRRTPQAWLCLFSDAFFGPWVQVDGEVEVVSLPEAMDLLVDYYRRGSGEHPDWDEYREAMRREQRCVLRITPTRAGPDRSG